MNVQIVREIFKCLDFYQEYMFHTKIIKTTYKKNFGIKLKNYKITRSIMHSAQFVHYILYFYLS